MWYLYPVLAVTLVMNVTAFILMAVDKKRARKGQWRIPERRLFLAAILMGGIGATLGMLKLRHKTRHWYFRLFFPVFALLQAGMLIWLCSLSI